MPRGKYARKQEQVGYRSEGYLRSKIKRCRDFRCERCGRAFVSRSLVVRLNESQTGGTVLCKKCSAEEVFGEPVMSIEEIASMDDLAPLGMSGHTIRRIAAQRGLKPIYGFLPSSVCSKLLENVVVNLRTGDLEPLSIKRALGEIQIDGIRYFAFQLADGGLLLRKQHLRAERKEHALEEIELQDDHLGKDGNGGVLDQGS